MKKLLYVILSFLLFGALPPALATTTTLQPTETAHLVQVQITSVNNRNVVIAEVKGKFLHLVLDTGATKTALFQGEDLEYTNHRQVGQADIIFPALDEKVTGSKLEPFDVDFGGYSYRVKEPLLILNRPPVGDRLNFAFDGVLGQDFFADHVVEITPSAQSMTLHPNGTVFDDKFAATIDIKLRGTAPYIEYTAQMPWEKYPKKKTMLLDTGYPGLMVFWNNRHFDKAVGRKRAQELRETNTGIFTRVSFRVGRVRYYHAPIFLAPNVPMQAQKRDGIIGSNVLNSHDHAFDFSGGKLYFGAKKVKYRHIDGGFYVPNNENFIFKRFNNHPIGPKVVLEVKDKN
jgi:hypothetical protein